jgi:ADP-ribosylglycohydrolase
MMMSSEYELNYKDCIREIISMSGDTDTNACIAGAVVGALLGFNKLDQSMV